MAAVSQCVNAVSAPILGLMPFFAVGLTLDTPLAAHGV